MNKRIFTPFPLREAGTLRNNLKYIPGSEKPSVVGKPDGRYKGFKPDEYVYSPMKNLDKGYKPDSLLSMLVEAEDQLYINAHCKRGKDYLSTRMSCEGSENKTVKIDDLILQLQAHGLPLLTRCKIKLWACEGALDDGFKESFAQNFSRHISMSGYTECRIFGYSLSVFGSYTDGPTDDPGVHKRAIKQDVADRLKLEELVSHLEKPNSSPPRGDTQMTWSKKVELWNKALGSAGGNKEAAIKAILDNRFKVAQFLGGLADVEEVKAHPAIVGARASTVRLCFQHGSVVPG